jgi:hypothetical protein
MDGYYRVMFKAEEYGIFARHVVQNLLTEIFQKSVAKKLKKSSPFAKRAVHSVLPES